MFVWVLLSLLACKSFIQSQCQGQRGFKSAALFSLVHLMLNRIPASLCSGAPGLGPLSMSKEVIVFKDGFRSRSYCLTECATVCSKIANSK